MTAMKICVKKSVSRRLLVLRPLSHHWPRAVMSQSSANIRSRPPTQRTDQLSSERRRTPLTGSKHQTPCAEDWTRCRAPAWRGETRTLLTPSAAGARRRSDPLTLFPCRAKELKALFGSLLQKSDHSLNSQAKKNEKLK